MAPAHQVIKKLKMDRICGSIRCIPLHAATATECAKKTKGTCQLTEILNTYTRQSNKHLLEISGKGKVLIKSYSA